MSKHEIIEELTRCCWIPQSKNDSLWMKGIHACNYTAYIAQVGGRGGLKYAVVIYKNGKDGIVCGNKKELTTMLNKIQ